MTLVSCLTPSPPTKDTLGLLRQLVPIFTQQLTPQKNPLPADAVPWLVPWVGRKVLRARHSIKINLQEASEQRKTGNPSPLGLHSTESAQASLQRVTGCPSYDKQSMWEVRVGKAGTTQRSLEASCDS